MGLYNLNNKYKTCFFTGDSQIREDDSKPTQDSFDYVSPSINDKITISISGDALVSLHSLEEQKNPDLPRLKKYVIDTVRGLEKGPFVVDTNLIKQFIFNVSAPQQF